jgi:hypothetical protein
MKPNTKNMDLSIFLRIKTGIRGIIDTLCEKLECSIIKHPSSKEKFVFGPVPSRRLGYSLGVNTIKRKICTYNCIYCQGGQTTCCSTERNCCLSPYELYFLSEGKLRI